MFANFGELKRIAAQYSWPVASMTAVVGVSVEACLNILHIAFLAALLNACGTETPSAMPRFKATADIEWGRALGVPNARYTEETLCLANVEYLFISHALAFTIVENRSSEGALISCGTENLAPAEHRSFIEVCRRGVLFYEFSDLRGVAVATAFEINGDVRHCT